MRWQLSGCGDFCGIGLLPMGHGLEAPNTQLFFGDRAAAQDIDLVATRRDDGRFNSVSGRSGIDYQRNPAAEFIQDMLCSRRADATEPVRARRSERRTKLANNFGKDWMLADSDGNRVQTGSYNFRHD